MIRRCAMTGFGLGYAPVASGTFGSAGAVAIALGFWALVYKTPFFAGTEAVVLNITWLVLTVLAYAGCIKWGPWSVDYYASRSRKPGDPGQVVLDEFAGQWMALVAIPMTTFKLALAVLAVQFFLFRLFDVVKPPPGRRLEKLPAGWGIASDDIVAGIYANIIGQVVFRLMWPM